MSRILISDPTKVFIIGDFNINSNSKERKQTLFTDKFGLLDIAAFKSMDLIKTRRDGKSANRLDRALVSSDFDCIYELKYSFIPFSDHLMLMLSCNRNNIYERYNRIGLTPSWNLENMEKMVESEEAQILMGDSCFDPQVKWLLLKKVAYEFIVKESLEVKRNILKEIEENDKEINKMVNLQDKSEERLMSLKYRNEYLLNVEKKFLLMKCKEEIYKTNQGLKWKLFTYLKKRKAVSNIHVLKVDSELIEGDLNIVKEAQSFFLKELENTFEKKRDKEKYEMIVDKSSYKFFKSKNCIKEKIEDIFLDDVITMEELLQVMRGIKTDVSAGPDGLGYSMYKVLEKRGREIFLDYINFLFQGQVSEHILAQNNEAYIKMIPKVKGMVENVTDIRKIRPIALMNSDMKILQKILLRRISPLINEILPEGVYGVKGRPISGALMMLHGVFSLRNKKRRTNSFIIKLDMENAFTNVNTEYFEYVFFKYLGINGTTSLIVSLIKNKMIAFINNKKISHFNIMRDGVFQGSPLSPVIYSVYLIELYLMLKESTEGVWVMDKLLRIGIVSYIDDINVMVANKKQLKKVYERIQQFVEITGVKINLRKSYVWDVDRGKELEYKEMKGKHDCILGIPFPLDNSSKMKIEVINKKISEIEEIASRISTSCKSWRGRVRLINALVLPKFIYYLPFVLLSKKLVSRVNAITQKCIFGRFKYLAHTKVVMSIKKGGLGLIELEVLNRVVMFNFVISQIYNDLRLKKLLSIEGLKRDHLLSLWTKIFREVSEITKSDEKTCYKIMASLTIHDPIKIRYYRNKEVNLKRLLGVHIEGCLENFVIKFSLRILPVKERLYRIGVIKSYNVDCPLGCGQAEDVDHLFWSCVEAGKFYLVIIGKAWKKYRLWEIWNKKSLKKINSRVRKFIQVMFFGVWKIRCRIVFQDIRAENLQFFLDCVHNEYRKDLFALTDEDFERTWDAEVMY